MLSRRRPGRSESLGGVRVEPQWPAAWRQTRAPPGPLHVQRHPSFRGLGRQGGALRGEGEAPLHLGGCDGGAIRYP